MPSTRDGDPGAGPQARWFVARALDGFAPKLALVDALLATLVAVVAASVWRVGAGARGGFEQIVPMLGTGLRWSVALPLSWAALGAMRSDREDGLLDLARRRGVSARRWILGRALGAASLVTLTVGVPMVIVCLVLAGFGGGVEGALSRASLVGPALLVAAATGIVFGVGGVVIGALVPSRPLAAFAIVGFGALGALVDLVVPGPMGVAAHQIVSPFLAVEDLQAAAFAVRGSAWRGAAAAVAIATLPWLGLTIAASSFERERARPNEGAR